MICAIVPAAGKSRRMGAKKQLLPWGATTVIGHIVDQLLLSGAVENVYVVVGRDAKRLVEDLARRPVHVVINPAEQAEMLSSVRCALRALPPECQAVVLAPGDQPAITAELVDQLVRAFRAAGKGILVPRHGGKRGHPIVFSASYRNEIMGHFDDAGLRGLLHAHADDVFELDVPTSDVLQDIDYPEDYVREIERRRTEHGKPPGSC
jgi:molybdenum cofactor cytidylyltransferase